MATHKMNASNAKNGRKTQFNSETASAAAKRAWEKRRQRKAELEAARQIDPNSAANIIKEELEELVDTPKGKVTKKRFILSNVLTLAAKGNMMAVELMLKLIGEDPSKKLEVTGKDGAPIIPAMTLEQAQEILNLKE